MALTGAIFIQYRCLFFICNLSVIKIIISIFMQTNPVPKTYKNNNNKIK